MMKITRLGLLGSTAVFALGLPCPLVAQVGATGAGGQTVQSAVAQVTVSRGIVHIERGGQREYFSALSNRDGMTGQQVVGHTDCVGSVAAADRLALCRTEKIRAQLIGQGFSAASAGASGRRERELLVAVADGVAEARKRPVEIRVR